MKEGQERRPYSQSLRLIITVVVALEMRVFLRPIIPGQFQDAFSGSSLGLWDTFQARISQEVQVEAGRAILQGSQELPFAITKVGSTMSRLKEPANVRNYLHAHGLLIKLQRYLWVLDTTV